MQLFQCPILSCPNKSRQVKLLHTLVAVHNYFDPVSADTHIRISLGYLFDWWQLGVELVRDLKEKHDATSLELSELLDSLLTIEDMLHSVVLYPWNDETTRLIAILLLHHLTKIIQIVLIVNSEPYFIVLVVLIQVILKKVALNILIFCTWNWQSDH